MGTTVFLYSLYIQCNKTAALDQLFLQLLDSPHPKVALIESGCSAVTEATAEISQHFNIIHVIINCIIERHCNSLCTDNL